MPAKPSGKIKTYTVHQTQKNGDIYVLERTMRYDPEKKNNVILGTKLISKIPKGESEPVPTRPKKRKRPLRQSLRLFRSRLILQQKLLMIRKLPRRLRRSLFLPPLLQTIL